MKARVLRFIVCPDCQGELALQGATQERIQYSEEAIREASSYVEHLQATSGESAEQIWESLRTNITAGSLMCEKCKKDFPILNGIPRLLAPELRTVPSTMGRGDPTTDTRIGFFDDSLPVVDPADSKFNEVQLANQSNYGYEWQAFAHEYDQWETLYKLNYVHVEDQFFRNKLGLDAGCGMARYSLPPVHRGAEVVGLDLSNAIESAYRKSLTTPFFHAIQGDIFKLPFRDGFFDFAQSLGVIHITPNPEAALLSVKRAVKHEGRIFMYVYQSYKELNYLKHVLLFPVMQLRKITVKLPSNVLYFLLYFMIPVVLLTCYLPSWILWCIPFTRKYSDMLPYSYEQYKDRRLRDMHMNLFDRFGNPVERRYTREEMKTWMSKVGFKYWDMRERYGWHVDAVVG